MYSFSGPDYYGIEGKNPEDVPQCPTGYIYCPGCYKVTKLRGISNKTNTWFGTCKCKYRIVFRPEDYALAYVDNNGILHSSGFESKDFETFIGDKVIYPYA